MEDEIQDGPCKSLLGNEFKNPQLVNFSDFVLADITGIKHQHRGLGFIKPIIRRSFLAKHDIHYQEAMRLGEDYELYAHALAMRAKLYIFPEQGYVSVVRSTSLSSHHSVTDLRHFRDCDLAISKLPGLSYGEKAALHQHYLSVDCRLQWRLLINATKKKDIRSAISTFFKPPGRFRFIYLPNLKTSLFGVYQEKLERPQTMIGERASSLNKLLFLGILAFALILFSQLQSENALFVAWQSEEYSHGFRHPFYCTFFWHLTA